MKQTEKNTIKINNIRQQSTLDVLNKLYIFFHCIQINEIFKKQR